jgi:SH3 domain-containing YSC84-like protein 1
MRTMIIGLMLLGSAIPLPAAAPEEDDIQLLKEAAAVLTELHATPDGDIPRALWLKAQCVVVIPGLTRAAFGIGGEFGEGVASCRTPADGWTPPAFMELAKGSWGCRSGRCRSTWCCSS